MQYEQYTSAEAAKILGLDTHTVEQHCRNDKFKGAEKRSGRWSIPAEALKQEQVRRKLYHLDLRDAKDNEIRMLNNGLKKVVN